eukprot:PITA_04013
MDEEYFALMENNTWDLVPLPKGRKLVRCRWIYRTKIAVDGEISKYKAQLITKGYSQIWDCCTTFLGLEVSQSTSRIKMAQFKYASDLLVCFQMIECKPITFPFLLGIRFEDAGTTSLVDSTLYRQLVGSLLYLTHTQLDISFLVGVFSRYMQKPHELHWKDAKRILRYVKGTSSFGIFYVADCPLSLIGYTDSNWVGDGTDRKSTSGYVFNFSSGPFYWSNKNKSMISLSTAEAEYRGTVNAATHAVWLHGLLSEFGI